ncbi:hypothetical protein TSAR_001972 [Trichomalopsis sarcophagae]|uniref:Uncharacterized protein n=1 Tax=Trichomalopsis sarcophagae TaxID=543379 RepID=A0A232EQ66_9HYME|nr:hypothetical protein TSAR_001972 [Trichomalopsis sarcophagae]
MNVRLAAQTVYLGTSDGTPVIDCARKTGFVALNYKQKEEKKYLIGNRTPKKKHLAMCLKPHDHLRIQIAINSKWLMIIIPLTA